MLEFKELAALENELKGELLKYPKTKEIIERQNELFNNIRDKVKDIGIIYNLKSIIVNH